MNEQLTGKVLYLRGLADGMQIDQSTNEGKLLHKIIDVLDEFAMEIARIGQEQEDQGDRLDEMQDNLDDLEEIAFDDDDDDEDWEDFDDEDDEDEEEGESSIRELGEGSFIEYECPHCKSKIYYDAKAFDLSEDHSCPDCGKELFPEGGAADAK